MKRLYVLVLALLTVACKAQYTLTDLENAINKSDTQLVSAILMNDDIYTEKDLLKFANVTINKTKNFEILKLLCENGLSVNSTLQIKKEHFITEKRLLHVAIEYDRTNFTNYLLTNGADITFPYYNYSDFVCYCFTNFKNKDLSFLLNYINEENYTQIDLVNLCRIFIVDKKFDDIAVLLQKEYVKKTLSENSKFPPVILLNYSDELINRMSAEFALLKLNYSDYKTCLANSIMSLNPDSVRFAISCGVNPSTELDWYDEPCSPKEYIENYINHLCSLDVAEKEKIKQSLYKTLLENRL